MPEKSALGNAKMPVADVSDPDEASYQPKQRTWKALFGPPVIVAVVTLTILIVSFPYAMDFLHNTKASFSPPLVSRTKHVEEYFFHNTEHLILGDPIYVQFDVKSGPPGNFSSRGCLQANLQLYTTMLVWMMEQESELFDQVYGYMPPARSHPLIPREEFLRNDGRSTLLVINTRPGKKVHDFVEMLRGQQLLIGNCTDLPEYYEIDRTITGVLTMVGDMKTSVMSDLAHVDRVSIPIALVALMVCLWSVRLIFVTLLCLPISLLVTFAVMYPVSNHLTVSTITPEVVAATVVALSIDFTLFLLTRFNEEHFSHLPQMKRLIDCINARKSRRSNTIDTLNVQRADTYGTAGRSENVSETSGLLRTIDEDPGHPSDTASDTSSPVMPHFTISDLRLELWNLRWHIVKTSAMSCSRNIAFSGFTIGGVFGVLCSAGNELVRTVAIGSVVGALASIVAVMICGTSLLFLAYPLLTNPIFGTRFPRLARLEFWVNSGCLYQDDSDDEDDTTTTKSTTNSSPRSNDDGGDDAGKPQRTAIEPPPAALSKTPQRSLSSFSLNRSSSSHHVHSVSMDDLSSHMDDVQLAMQRRSPWFKIGSLAAKYPAITIMVCILFSVPFCAALRHLKIGYNLYSEVPTNSGDTIHYKEIVKRWGPSIQDPYYFVYEFSPSYKTPRVFTQPMMDTILDGLAELERNPSPLTLRVVNPFNYNGRNMTTVEEVFEAYQNGPNSTSPYKEQWEMFCMGNPRFITACVIPVLTIADPYVKLGEPYMKYLEGITNTLLDEQKTKHLDFVGLLGFYGANVDSYVIMNDVYRQFRIQLVFVALFMFVAVIVVFRSYLLAVRLVFTVIYTIAIAIGAACIAYCGAFSNTLGKFGVHDKRTYEGVDSLMWMVPIITVPLMIALALDYDSFLLSRFFDLRRMGFSDSAAITKAVYRTGRTISFIGVVMAIALGSLMLSHAIMLQQVGMIMTVAVVVDTFIVRPFLVPALVTILPGFLWYPRRDLPEPTLTVDDPDLVEN